MLNRKQKFIENWKKDRLVWVAIGTIAVLFYPTGFIHELGHVVVCTGNGFEYAFRIDGFVLNINCSGTPQPLLLYFALGGIFGMSASVALFLIPHVRRNRGVFIGVSVLAFDHFLKSIFETFAHSSYLHNTLLGLYMGGISICFMLLLILFFHKHSKKIS